MSGTKVNITHVVMNEHGPIFAELIVLLVDVLGRLGLEVTLTTNRLRADRLNLVVGHTIALPAADLHAIRSGSVPYIVFQSEALNEDQGFIGRYPLYVEFLRSSRHVWDYSQGNLGFLTRLGCRSVSYVPLGYSPVLERVTPLLAPDIDVLFYGAITPRRQAVLADLQARGVRVAAQFGTYGSVRDEVIGRSKIVLNVHQFDTPQLEQVRLSYLLNNGRFVISELADADPYEGGVVFCPYPEIAGRCEAFLAPGADAERGRIARVGYETLKAIPIQEHVRAALDRCAD